MLSADAHLEYSSFVYFFNPKLVAVLDVCDPKTAECALGARRVGNNG